MESLHSAITIPRWSFFMTNDFFAICPMGTLRHSRTSTKRFFSTRKKVFVHLTQDIIRYEATISLTAA
jgi:hypothetical protein